MDQNQAVCASRRDALKLGMSAGVGIAIVVMTGGAVAAPNKLTKESVKYTDSGNVEGKDCDDCSQYVPGASAKDPASCKIVEGSISPHGHCIAFSPKGKT
jgi:uncharacterized Fe-S center protein